MSQNPVTQTQNKPLTLQTMIKGDSIQKRFNELLGKKSQGFISSLLNIVNNNKLLKTADPKTVLTAAVTAASLDLPINPNLGFAWIVPYKKQAQFQMGWKGFVQLAQRTGQYKRINVVEVYENQFKSFDALSEELDCDFTIEGEGAVKGYAAMFELVNGFKKLEFWSKDKVIKHAKKYSQTYGKQYNGRLVHSPWNDETQFDAMAKKTVLKNTLSKWGIMSIEMQTAQMVDQSIQVEEDQFSYPDNESEDNVAERWTEDAEVIEEQENIEEDGTGK
jgi:recombination protein RecT